MCATVITIAPRVPRLDWTPASRRGRRRSAAAIAAACAFVLAGCGGSGSDPLGNPAQVSNPTGASGQTLSFAYFQRCINPIFLALLQIQLNGTTATNTCAAAGCHATATGAGGAFRVVPAAPLVDLSNAANTADVIRASDMYKNFYSAQSETLVGAPLDSKLVKKPLLLNVLHGGGRVFSDTSDPHVHLMEYWINNPVPNGADEFSTSNYNMFTPADPMNGTCNTQ